VILIKSSRLTKHHAQAEFKKSLSNNTSWKSSSAMTGGLNPVGGNLTLVNITCYPLHDILCAADLNTIDLLSLDIQGLEFDVIKTIPWENVDIQVSV
jgi:hypothetical protein